MDKPAWALEVQPLFQCVLNVAQDVLQKIPIAGNFVCNELVVFPEAVNP